MPEASRPTRSRGRRCRRVCLAALLFLTQPACPPERHEKTGHQLFASPQSNPVALSGSGDLLFVACTTSNRVEFVDTAGAGVIEQVPVGIEPVSLAVRPDRPELWVSNHLSDSISVVDVDPLSPTFATVVRTVEERSAAGVTLFDEPVGIAFAQGGSRAYVALSSQNEIAVIDTDTYAVVGSLDIAAQEPRALAVQRSGPGPNDPELLFVAAFESGNRTELSICAASDGTDQCTLDLFDFVQFSFSPNLPGAPKNIVVDPERPDGDLFVFDTATNQPVAGSPVEGVGTLLFGVAADHTGRAYVTHTEARNHVNGRESDDPDGDGVASAADLENHPYANGVSIVDCGGGLCRFDPASDRIDLDVQASRLATPFGAAVSEDGTALVLTAAGSDRLAVLDPGTGVATAVTVGAVPRGVALRSGPTGAPETAWVLNTLGNSVSAVDLSNPGAPVVTQTVPVGSDPTPEAVRLGRIAFNDADVSSSGTFSCASCHPDGHTDQLLWRIGPGCEQPGCLPGQHLPRRSMSVRGLRDTLPLHSDGTLGDPRGGPNGSVGGTGQEPASCDGSDPTSCFRVLVDATIDGFMCDPSTGCGPGAGLSDDERSQLALFLERIASPPARARPSTDVVSNLGRSGFEEFFVDQGGFGRRDRATCADHGCHELPLGASTNSLQFDGFDAPSLRGLTDRHTQFSLAITGSEEFLQATTSWTPALGPPDEFIVLQAAFDALLSSVYDVTASGIFQMVEEASSGHSGALGRQVTLGVETTATCPSCDVEAILAELEAADTRQVVNLRGQALHEGQRKTLSFHEGVYLLGTSSALDRTALVQLAQQGDIVATLTAHARRGVSTESPQPLISVPFANCGSVSGIDPVLPTLSGGQTWFEIEGRHVLDGDPVFVNGENWTRLHGAALDLVAGPVACDQDADETNDSATPLRVQVDLGVAPPPGFHLLQVQAAAGLLSNELPFRVE